MFHDESSETVEFISTVTSETTTLSNPTQTMKVEKKSQGIQKLKYQDSETQTVNTEVQIPNINYDRLAVFLKRVTPDLLEALDEPFLENFSNTSTSTIQKPQARLIRKCLAMNDSNSQKKISALSWSISGGVLAISYSTLAHKTWCDHLSEVKLYEFTRHDEMKENSCTTYETNACVSRLAYHPTEPSILSAGLFNGDIVLWNLTSDNPSTPMNIYTHGDTVTSLIWRPGTINDPTLLVTSSSDGYIMFHKLSANFTKIDIYRRFKIIKEHNPVENSRPRSAGGPRERAIEAGLAITCLDFSPKNPIIFFVGTLCGGIYKCSTDAATQIRGDDSLIDPVVDQFVRCKGSITCVKCSQISNLLVSSDTHKEIRVHDLAESRCICIIQVEHTITGLEWIIDNKDIIVAYGADPIVKCYKISNDTISPIFQIECTISNSSCLDINKKRDLVGITDSGNNLEIWKVPKEIE